MLLMRGFTDDFTNEGKSYKNMKMTQIIIYKETVTDKLLYLVLEF